MKTALEPIAITMVAFSALLLIGIAVEATGKHRIPAAAAIPATNPWAPGKWEAEADAYIKSHSPPARPVKTAARSQDQPGAPWRVQFGCVPERCFEMPKSSK
jgi:hypothetical protein